MYAWIGYIGCACHYWKENGLTNLAPCSYNIYTHTPPFRLNNDINKSSLYLLITRYVKLGYIKKLGKWVITWINQKISLFLWGWREYKMTIKISNQLKSTDITASKEGGEGGWFFFVRERELFSFHLWVSPWLYFFWNF